MVKYQIGTVKSWIIAGFMFLVILLTVIIIVVVNRMNQQKMIIKYVFGYNIWTYQALEYIDPGFIDITEIKLTGKDLREINRLVKKMSFEKIEQGSGVGSHWISVFGQYELMINQNTFLVCDSENRYAVVYEKDPLESSVREKLNSYYVRMPEELNKKLTDLIEENEEKSIKKPSTSQIKITNKMKKTEKVVITDKKEVNQILEKLSYHAINLDKMEDRSVELYQIDFDDGTKIIIYAIIPENYHGEVEDSDFSYSTSVLAYLESKTEKTYVKLGNNFDEYINDIYQSHISN